jgi:ACS family D-galactonate transporter-like MFS transporter
MEASRDQGQGYPAYRSLWVWLLLGWVVAYVDRTITGPVISYMIDNDLAFVAQAVNPYALGGLIGSMFFAGYILTQFPGGYLGDRFGHRTIIIVSLFWAGVATLLSGLMTGLIVFVAFRVITGLGEGTFYSNDRTVITQQTPFEKRGLGMGIAIAGLPIGLTLALIFTVPMIGLGESVLGAGNGWRMPFFISGVITLVVGFGVLRFFRGQRGEHEFRPAFLPSLRSLGKYSLVFLVVIMAIFLAADWVSLPEWAVAVLITLVAISLVGFAFGRKGEEVGPVLYDRNLILIYISAIAILWNLWFFSFWSVSIVSQAAPQASFLHAALTAALNAGAGILGFPLGGWIADYAKRKGWGRKVMLIPLTVAEGLLTVAFCLYLIYGGQALSVMGILLFFQAIFFFALQPISQALTADLVPSAAFLGAAFGMWNLIGEMGAVLSPGISGALRDATGSWNTAVMLDAGVILASAVVLLFVKESRAATAGQHSEVQETT